MELWSQEADRIRIKLLSEGRSYGEVAAELNEVFGTTKFSKDSVRGRARRTNTSVADVVQHEDYKTFNECWHSFCEMIGQAKTALVEKEMPVISSKFVVMSDIHCPNHNKEAIVQIVESVKDEVRTCVIGGDFFDNGAFSPHFQQIPPDPVREIQEAKALAKYLDESFETVVYVFGNHDNWYNKAKSKLPKEFQLLLKDYLIEYVIADLPNSYMVKEFFAQIGDCVVGHPSMFRQKRMSDAIVSYEYFNNWKNRLNLNNVRCYVHAHTHRLGCAFIESAGQMVKIFESGALCLPAEHISVGHVVNYAPPTEGYVVIAQDEDGNTIFNESREYYVDTPPPMSYAVTPGGGIQILK